MKELVFEELTLEQKAGLVLIGGGSWPLQRNKEEMEFQLDLIKKGALGGIWIQWTADDPLWKDTIKLVRELADYPILIFCDAGGGFPPHTIGQMVALGYCNDDRLAYIYGKTLGVRARQSGYNLVGNPLLDRVDRNVPCGGVMRTLHPDKQRAAELAAQVIQGMHDGGLMAIGKHYPSVETGIDSHMAESSSPVTKEELLEDNLYPYRYLNERGLLDAVMTGHVRLPNIDPDAPVSLSKAGKDVFREAGFDGLMLTDALSMMGVVAKFGYEGAVKRSLATGNDLALPFSSMKKAYKAVLEGIESGEISEEALNTAVKRVLKAQHASTAAPEFTALTEEEEALFASIGPKSIAAICDPGLTPVIGTEKKHLFMIMTENDLDLSKPRPDADSLTTAWFDPYAIKEHILKRFPNSGVSTITEYPGRWDIARACDLELEYDDVIFLTVYRSYPYVGREAFTPRIISVFEAWQQTDRIQAVVHLGNPFVLEDLPHVPRVLNACGSRDTSLAVFDVLAGLLPAEGTIPYRLKLQ